MQRVVLGQPVTLEAVFTDGRGRLVDPPSVLVSIFDYLDVERVSDAAPQQIAPGRYAYTYLVPGDGTVGAWRIVWDAQISGAPAGGTEAFDVVAPGQVSLPGGGGQVLPGVTVLSVDELLAAGDLGPVDAGQRAALHTHLVGLTARLEQRLGRPLIVREFTETVTVADDGRPLFGRTPVVQVLEAVAVAATPGQMWPVTLLPTEPVGAFRPGVQLTVRYLAGIDGPSNPAIKAVVASKALAFANTLLGGDSPPDADSEQPTPTEGGLVVPAPPKGVAAFAVEGLNVTYESESKRAAAELQAAKLAAELAQWSDAELADLSRLRRRVVA